MTPYRWRYHVSQNVTDPKRIASLLISEHDIRPSYAESSVEGPFVELAITTYVRRLISDELLELIVQTERSIAKPEKFMAALNTKKYLGPDAEWIELLQCMAEFILARALEAAFDPVVI
jgi:hypothetical protein